MKSYLLEDLPVSQKSDKSLKISLMAKTLTPVSTLMKLSALELPSKEVSSVVKNPKKQKV